MKNKSLTRLIRSMLTIIMIIVLTGCATKSGGKKMEGTDNTPPVPALETPYNQIFVCDIETTPALMKDYNEALQACQSTLISSLLKMNKYEKVEAAKFNDTYQKATLLVKLKISDMRIASTGARIWGGVFAGRSYMYIHMTLVDTETQKVVREEDFNSTNNAFAAAWSFGATDRNMPVYMAEIMAEYIAKAVRHN